MLNYIIICNHADTARISFRISDVHSHRRRNVCWYAAAVWEHRQSKTAETDTSVVQTIHSSMPAMLHARISVQEKTRPYSWTSDCVCINERIVKQA